MMLVMLVVLSCNNVTRMVICREQRVSQIVEQYLDQRVAF